MQFPILQAKMIEDAWDGSNLDPKTHKFENIKYGQLYRDAKGNYFMFVAASREEGTTAILPTESAYVNDWDVWLPIRPDKHNRD